LLTLGTAILGVGSVIHIITGLKDTSVHNPAFSIF
jgi:hypothetical protein